MTRRSTHVGVLLVLLCGCDVRVAERPTASVSVSLAQPCVDHVTLATEQVAGTVSGYLSQGKFECARELIDGAVIRPEDNAGLTDVLLDALGKPQPDGGNLQKSRPLPAETKLAALSYLNVHHRASTAKGFRLNDYGDYIRAEAGREGARTRARAFALLYNIVTDEDVPLIVEGFDSGDETIIAMGIFSLANRCTPIAVKALRGALEKQTVIDYLEKYKGKETLTSTMRRECPKALG